MSDVVRAALVSRFGLATQERPRARLESETLLRVLHSRDSDRLCLPAALDCHIYRGGRDVVHPGSPIAELRRIDPRCQ